MFYKRKIIAIVPARSGSKGIKNKNIKKINGKPLIYYTSKFIDNCKFFDQKVLTSDGDKILDIGKKLGFKLIKRKKNLSGDFVSDYRVIMDILVKKKISQLNYDYVVYLQPTSPLRSINHLKSALKTTIDKNFSSSWSVSKIDKKFHPLKILNIKNQNLKIYLNNGKNVIARQMLDDIYIRNGIFYIFKISDFLKNNSIYFDKCYPSITTYNYVNIDEIEDLKIAKNYLKN